MIDLPDPLTRPALLKVYRPIRAAIQTVLTAAVDRCGKPDFDRAAKHLGLVDAEQMALEDTAAMLCDIALFEPNQRGRRAYDRFLARGAEALDPPERAVAERLGGAFFSVFRVAQWHAFGGVWVENLLDGDRRFWLMDEGLEASASEGMVIGLRVFDVGPFHAGLGLIVDPDSVMVGFCIEAAARGNPLPVRHSMAATFYGDAIAEATMPVMLGSMVEEVAAMNESERRAALDGLDRLVDPNSPGDAELRDLLVSLVGAVPPPVAPPPTSRRKRRR
ncbi:hypothetical protein [Methylobacterium goesingense]|uniref:Uncharacterized protein n=1 Tax=Methylobacterium goesingense TaxID=243690 RepID=A0ABV2L0M1_9HYPH|nr:hypothetical protein [Methylobacterium goesingense]GJD76623.1 hypothetical protein CFIICLFH_4881 [Methylobacterium goesingense]